MKEYVSQRGKTWTYWIDVGLNEAGKRQRETKGGFKNESAARAAARRRMVEIEKDGYTKLTKQMVEPFMREWLESAKSRTRPATWAQYEALTIHHIIPDLGATQLPKLTASQLNGWYGRLLQNGRSNGKGGLSPRTVGHIHATLRLALNDAVKWGSLSRNVALSASPPKKQRPSLNTWSAEEARDFLASVRDDRLYAAYALALATGLRKGELLGLAWRDVDLEAGWLNVRQTLISVNYKPQLSTPKTASGRRSVALDASTVEMLREHRLRQLKERHTLGMSAQQPDDLVFAGLEGQPLHPALFTDTFDRRVKAAKVPRIRFHDVRHTAATLMLAAGIHPKVVQERLGHSSVSITLDLYSHSVPALQQEAASKLGALLFQ